MLKSSMNLRRHFAQTLLGLVATSMAVLAVQTALYRVTASRPWIELVTLLSLSLLLAAAAGFILWRWLLKPMRERLSMAESTLERAILMQEAMKPALSTLAGGLEHNHEVLEEIALDFAERRVRDDGEHSPSKLLGMSPRVLRLAASLKDLRKEAGSRAQIANTLLAANDTVGLRHAELQNLLGAIKDILKFGNISNAIRDARVDPGFAAPGGETLGADAEPSTVQPDSPPIAGTGYSWSSEPSQPLMPHFNIPKDQDRARFGKN